jgi:hypothetical protein
MSTAYHPERDGQTETYNRVLEHYLRSFIHHQPKIWSQLLPLAEWSYNTSLHSATGLTSFQITYGRDPPSIPHYISHSSTIEAVDSILSSRQQLLTKLQTTLKKAQDRMKYFADRKRRPIVFNIGDYVYVQLRPYRQKTVTSSSYSKLSKLFYGPFKILEKIGLVAYRLDLPSSSQIHPVFHCSKLKLHQGPLPSINSLPPSSITNHPIITPLAILKTQLDHSTSPPTKKALVQWLGLPLEETSWENWDELITTYHLEDKVTFEDPGDVSNYGPNPLNNNDTDPGPSKRTHKKPAYLDDYVSA